MSHQRSDPENALKDLFKRWPKAYRLASLIIAPILITGMTDRKFIARSAGKGRVLLNVGSGPTRLAPEIVNVDVFPFRNVDVLADAAHLPFADATFDVVCCDQVLEHVTDPYGVVRELIRVTKPGGEIFVGVPFLYPYHPSPKDYSRWTLEGLASLFDGHDVTRRSIAMGPTSALLLAFTSWFATMFSFGIRPLRILLSYVAMLACFPFKFLDLIAAHLPGADISAASVAIVVRKR